MLNETDMAWKKLHTFLDNIDVVLNLQHNFKIDGLSLIAARTADMSDAIYGAMNEAWKISTALGSVLTKLGMAYNKADFDSARLYRTTVAEALVLLRLKRGYHAEFVRTPLLTVEITE